MTFKIGDCVEYVGMTAARKHADILGIKRYTTLCLKKGTSGVIEVIRPYANCEYAARVEEIKNNEIFHQTKIFHGFELKLIE